MHSASLPKDTDDAPVSATVTPRPDRVSGIPASRRLRVLVAAHDSRERQMLTHLLGELRASVRQLERAEAILDALETTSFDLALLGARVQGASGLQTLATARARGVTLPVIIMTAHSPTLRFMVSDVSGVLSSRIMNTDNFTAFVAELARKQQQKAAAY